MARPWYRDPWSAATVALIYGLKGVGIIARLCPPRRGMVGPAASRGMVNKRTQPPGIKNVNRHHVC